MKAACLITDSNEQEEVKLQVMWCYENSFSLNGTKTEVEIHGLQEALQGAHAHLASGDTALKNVISNKLMTVPSVMTWTAVPIFKSLPRKLRMLRIEKAKFPFFINLLQQRIALRSQCLTHHLYLSQKA